MNYDISESVSPRGRGEETPENRRIYEIADEFLRRCQLYEAQLRDGKNHVSPFEIEQRVAKLFAKESGMWIPISKVYDLGWLRLGFSKSTMKDVSQMTFMKFGILFQEMF